MKTSVTHHAEAGKDHGDRHTKVEGTVTLSPPRLPRCVVELHLYKTHEGFCMELNQAKDLHALLGEIIEWAGGVK